MGDSPGHTPSRSKKESGASKWREDVDLGWRLRFPVYLVSTYPGDHALFASPGFRDWLPKDLPLVEAHLEDIMEMSGGPESLAPPQSL
jgi:hypothetical protein